VSSRFSTLQFEAAYPEGIERHWWSLARSRIVAGVLGGAVPGGTRTLEVGCGRGVAVKNLRDLGVECTGVELAQVEPLAAVREWVKTGTDALDLPVQERESYAALLLLDVIEHLPDPTRFLRDLLEAFPRASCVLVTVPAGEKLWSNYDEYYGHHRRYSLPMLREVGAHSGLSVSLSRYFFHCLYPPARLLTALGRERETHVAAPESGFLWLHRAMACLLQWEFRLFPGFMSGTSAIACYRPLVKRET